MKNLEKTYESAIEDMKDSLFEVYKKGFESNTGIQQLVHDAESCTNSVCVAANNMNGVDFQYYIDDYFNINDFKDMKKEALTEYLQELGVTIKESVDIAFTSTCEEIFIDSHGTIHYTPTDETYQNDDEFSMFVWGNYKCEEHGIYCGFYEVDINSSVESSNCFEKYGKFWNLIKSFPSGRIKRILKEVLDAQMSFEDATLMVITGEINK